MNDPMMLPMFIGLVVILLVGGAGLVLSKSFGSVAEQRLDGVRGRPPPKAHPASGVLLRPPPIDLAQSSPLSKLIPDVGSRNRLNGQAAVSPSFERFMRVVGVLAVLGGVAPVVFGPHPLLAPVGAAAMGGLPFAWLVHRKKKRMKK